MAVESSMSLMQMAVQLLAGIVSGLIVLLGVFIKVGRKLQQVDTIEADHRGLKSQVARTNELLTPKLQQVDAIESDHRDLKKQVGQMHELLVGIRAALVQAGILKDVFLTSASPITLTDIGRKALEDSGFIKLFSNQANSEKIMGLVDAVRPSNAYDVQQASISAIQSLDSEPMFDEMKLYMFRQGKTLSDLLMAAGIYIRDQYLEQHPEIPR